MKDDSVYLRHMRDAALEIEGRVGGVTRDDFNASRDLQIILTYLLQVIGEAARLVPESTRDRIPLPWRLITGMRHRLVHEYFRVDVNIVWVTATTQMRPLIDAVEPALRTGAIPLIEGADAPAGRPPDGKTEPTP